MAFRIAITSGLLCLAFGCASAAAQEAPAIPSVAAPSAPAQGAAPALPPAATGPSSPLSAAPIPVRAAVAPHKPRRRIARPTSLLETALPNDPSPTFQPDTASATARAAERYGAIVQAGGWPTDIAPLRQGARGPAVAELRRRLAIEGDLDRTEAVDGSGSEVWDADLTVAVKRFQARMGLRQTGSVTGATLKAIRVPASVRYAQLAASARRLSNVSFSFGPRYVVVNIPSTSVEAVEDGRVVHRYIAIVGDVEHPSPEISAHISVINLNPTWTVPTSIIKNEIIPRMQRDPGYLAREKIRILDGAGDEIDPRSINWATQRAANYILRQDSGAGNSLGSIRLGMPNKLAVYMHDTPSKRLFGSDYRFLSHGCVRVQGVYDLAEWLLQGTGGSPVGAWDKAALMAKVKEGVREDIRLTQSVPVIWVYLTGWANRDGVVHFRDDVYGIDSGDVATAGAATTAAATATAAAINAETPEPQAPSFLPLPLFGSSSFPATR